MATSNKDFRVKNGLIVEGATATVNGDNVITESSSIGDLSDVNVSGASNGEALVYNAGVWGPAVVEGGGGGAGATTYVTGPTAPDSPESGDIWFNTDSGLTSIYYSDTDTSQWVELAEGGLQGPTGPTGPITAIQASADAPTSPVGGQVWFDIDDAKLYFYYVDADSSQWVEVATAGTQGASGASGADGPTGPAGPTGAAGVGLPSGGSAGDILVKASGTDYDFSLKSPRIFRTGFVSVNFNNASWTIENVFDTSSEINVGGFSVTSSAVTVPETGYYMISWNIGFTSSGQRAAPEVSLGINGAQDDVLYAAHSYIRNANDHDTVSSNASGIVYLSSGDQVNIYGRREALDAAVDSIAGVGSFNMHKIY